MKHLIAAAVAVLVLAGCTGGKDAVDPNAGSAFQYVASTKKGTTIAVASRKQVGAVSGTLMDGSQYALSSDAGKVVVLNFWASWCGPCKTESPNFDTVYRKVKARGVAFVGIDVLDVHSDAQSFIKDNDITYPNVFDENARTALQLGKVPTGQGLPLTVLVDKHQRVAGVYHTPLQPADLEPLLDSLIGEQ